MCFENVQTVSAGFGRRFWNMKILENGKVENEIFLPSSTRDDCPISYNEISSIKFQ